jgi:hypothetical protein
VPNGNGAETHQANTEREDAGHTQAQVIALVREVYAEAADEARAASRLGLWLRVAWFNLRIGHLSDRDLVRWDAYTAELLRRRLDGRPCPCREPMSATFEGDVSTGRRTGHWSTGDSPRLPRLQYQEHAGVDGESMDPRP